MIPNESIRRLLRLCRLQRFTNQNRALDERLSARIVRTGDQPKMVNEHTLEGGPEPDETAESQQPGENGTVPDSAADADNRLYAEEYRMPGVLIVGIGASAGGLDALQQFFDHMPGDSGMAFVVVTHQPAGRVSLMPDLLARHSPMPVSEIGGPTRVEPNHVYLARGGVAVGLQGDTLVPEDPVLPRARTLVIDSFFRALARAAGENAVGIVLSGTGSDGTLGVREIKAQSGMTMAQDEGSALYSSMPRSAIASLHVDYVLSPADMPSRLLSYASTLARRVDLTQQPAQGDDLLGRVLLLLRSRTGHDFSYYKGTTIRRRVERRMNVHQMESRAYLHYLQNNAGEVDRLFKELLIGVTSFFRDPNAHEALAALLPDLFHGKPQGYVFRVWVPGCSTGEEAYSLAMGFKEAMDRTNSHFGIQVFATDLDPDAIEIARTGEYPESISADVSPKRLERFFTPVDGYYRIKKEIREMLVFAPQNLVDDPPFTKLDLLSCRNLLIYFDAKLQQRLMPMFHYALRPGGLLFLGTSEAVGSFGHLFEPLDKKWKIFRRRVGPSTSYVTELPNNGDLGRRELAAPSFGRRSVEPTLAQSAERALIQNLVPPAIVMHERGEIVHIHGRTGQFLEPAPGPQTSANVYNMAREGLQLDLAVAVRHAMESETGVIQRGVRVKSNGHEITVDLRVKRLSQPEHLRGLFLVAFENAEPVKILEANSDLAPAPEAVPGRLAELERELQHAKEVHQSTVEELETANEELKSTNEELQSTNEELQSANEELETSKEEMQSLNEELQTVNAELQGKVEELSRTNDDMKNLLNGTDIATIFLDNDLNIKRYTDQAKKVVRLIPSDVGRPVGDLVSKLKHQTLSADAAEVLHTLVFKEAEVQTDDGAWYLMRMLPYRTTDNVIDGLVVTFVDITKIKGLQEDWRRLIVALGSAPTAIFGQTADLVYDWAFGNILGQTAERMIGRRDQDLFSDDGRVLAELKREVIARGQPLRRRIPLGFDGARRTHDIYLQPTVKAGGEVVGISGVLTALDEPSDGH